MSKIQTIGIHPNIPNEDYHASKGISASGIKLIMDCPKRYWYQYLSGEYERTESKAMTIGTVVHTLALEPDTFLDRFFVLPNIDRRTKEGKALYAKAMEESQGKQVITDEIYQTAKAMAKSITDHKMFKKMEITGNIEDSLLWKDEDTGAFLRSRPDYYNDFAIVDVKTTDDVSPKGFARSIAKYGYHIQAAMACDGLSTLTGRTYENVVLFVVEKTAPYLSAAYVISAPAIEQGRNMYKKGASVYADCLAQNKWPSYPEKIVEIDLPVWAYYTDETE